MITHLQPPAYEIDGLHVWLLNDTACIVAKSPLMEPCYPRDANTYYLTGKGTVLVTAQFFVKLAFQFFARRRQGCEDISDRLALYRRKWNIVENRLPILYAPSPNPPLPSASQKRPGSKKRKLFK